MQGTAPPPPPSRRLLAQGYANADLQEAWKMFRKADQNADGRVDVKELRALLAVLQIRASATQIVRQFDAQGVGALEFAEFAQYALVPPQPPRNGPAEWGHGPLRRGGGGGGLTQPPVCRLLGAADTQTAHPATSSTTPGTPTTGLRERGNDTSKSTGRSGRQNAATRRNMRREERVTVQGPVKEQQPDGVSHGGGGGGETRSEARCVMEDGRHALLITTAVIGHGVGHIQINIHDGKICGNSTQYRQQMAQSAEGNS